LQSKSHNQSQSRSRRDSASLHSFRLHSDTEALGNDSKRPPLSGSRERQRSFERNRERDSGILSGGGKEERRKSRPMPTSPGLKKYNQAVSTGEFNKRR